MFRKKIYKYFKNPYRIFSLLGSKNKLKYLPDKMYLKMVYRGYLNKKLNLDKPITYNEKLQWLKLYDRNPKYVQMVDKYRVRDYVARKIGQEYLVPLLGVYKDFDQIDFSTLPNQFVLKCNHDSGSVIICKDKKSFDIQRARWKINKWLKRNFYYSGREWPYKYVQPLILCEKYLNDDIVDYKIMCFHGEPKLIQLHLNSQSEDHTIDFYDVFWRKTKIRRKEVPNSHEILTKPDQLQNMLDIAKILSKGDIHVRIDLYYVNGKIYFGEKTYYSASGFARFAEDSHDELLGSWISLPNKHE